MYLRHILDQKTNGGRNFSNAAKITGVEIGMNGVPLHLCTHTDVSRDFLRTMQKEGWPYTVASREPVAFTRPKGMLLLTWPESSSACVAKDQIKNSYLLICVCSDSYRSQLTIQFHMFLLTWVTTSCVPCPDGILLSPPLLFFTVNFDHFQILRAIGKGSFGKVMQSIYIFINTAYVFLLKSHPGEPFYH